MATTTENTSQGQGSAGGAQAGLRDLLAGLASFRFALTVVLLLAVACIVGSVLPQGEQVDRYLAVNPGAQGRMQVLAVLGLTHVFSSWWFVGLLVAFAASLLACTARRFGAIRRATGPARLRVLGSFVTHVSILLVLLGGVMRVLWGEKGVLGIREHQLVSQYEGPKGLRPLPFSVHLQKFEIEMHTAPVVAGTIGTLLVEWPEQALRREFPVALHQTWEVAPAGEVATTGNTCRIQVLRYLPDLVVGGAVQEAVSRSDEPNNPALQLQVVVGGTTSTNWVFARFPDFGAHGAGAAAHPLRFRFVSAGASAAPRSRQIKAFTSTLQLVEGGVVVREAVVRVNAPLSYRGYTLYQSGYNPQDPAWTSLQVVRDPGVVLVLTGFVLMLVGLTVVFCVSPGMASRAQGTGLKT